MSRVLQIPRTGYSTDPSTVVDGSYTSYATGMAFEAVLGALLLLATVVVAASCCCHHKKKPHSRKRTALGALVVAALALGCAASAVIFISELQSTVSSETAYGADLFVDFDAVLGGFTAPLQAVLVFTEQLVPTVDAYLATATNCTALLDTEIQALGPGPASTLLATEAGAQLDAINTAIADIESQLVEQSALQSIQSACTQALQQLGNITAQVDAYKPTYATYRSAAQFWVFTGVWVSALILGVALLALSLVGTTKVACILLCILLFLFSFLVMLMWPLAVALDDGCIYGQEQLDTRVATNSTAWACYVGAPLLPTIQVSNGQTADQALDFYNRIVFPTFGAPPNATYSPIYALATSGDAARFACMNATLARIDSIQVVLTPLLTVAQEIRTAATCGVLGDTFRSIQAELCDNVPPHLVGVALSLAALVAVALTALFFGLVPAWNILCPRTPANTTDNMRKVHARGRNRKTKALRYDSVSQLP